LFPFGCGQYMLLTQLSISQHFS